MHTGCEINIHLYWSVPLLIDFDLNKCLERGDALSAGQEEMTLHSRFAQMQITILSPVPSAVVSWLSRSVIGRSPSERFSAGRCSSVCSLVIRLIVATVSGRLSTSSSSVLVFCPALGIAPISRWHLYRFQLISCVVCLDHERRVQCVQWDFWCQRSLRFSRR